MRGRSCVDRAERVYGRHPEEGSGATLERLSGSHAGSNVISIAGRLPLHASSSGLVLLAFADQELQDRILAGRLAPLTQSTVIEPAALRRKLAEIRTIGHVIAPGYIEEVSTGVAVPLRDQEGSVTATLSVVLPRDAETDFALVELFRAARDIERSLGHRN